MISVIIPVRNGMPVLEEQLRALQAQRCDEPWEVVIADNGSTDDSLAFARDWASCHPNVVVVDASGLAGTSAARNAGVEVSHGEYLAFCDADDVVLAGWLHARTAPPLPHTLAAASSPSPQYTTVLSRLASRGSALASMPIFCVCTPNNAAPRRSVRQCVPRAPRARARSAPTCTNTSVDSEWLMMYSMALSPSESYSGTQYTL